MSGWQAELLANQPVWPAEEVRHDHHSVVFEQ